MSSFHPIIVTSLNAFSKVMITHSWAVKTGTTANIYTANNILNGYIRCHKLGLAYKLFDEMPQRDTVSWNTMITGYVNHGNLELALETLKNMQRRGFELDGHTFGSILKGAALARRCDMGRELHSVIVKSGHSENVYCGSALLDMYAKCGSADEAFLVFEHMPGPNAVSWNALISCCVQDRDRGSAFRLLSLMERDGVGIDEGTVAPLLTLLDEPRLRYSAMQVHGKVTKHGLGCEVRVRNATISSYSECGSVQDAERAFGDSLGARDLVTWNSMIGAYLVHGRGDRAFGLFLDMQESGFEPDIYSYTSVISGCFEQARKSRGKCLHGLVMKRGLENSVPVSNALIAMYLKSSAKSMVEARNIFESMELKDRVSWNSILTGLSQSGLSEDALRFFVRMRYDLVDIDHYTFSAVLRSCSDLATLQLGRQVHGLALKSGLGENEFVVSSLIFMYSKCGIITDSRKSFEENPKEGSIVWNSIIFAYGQHGLGPVALDLFSQMKETGVNLDHITFVAVLTACSHAGLVEKGRKVLKSMESDYNVTPRAEHFACAVDLYGRAGLLDEAKALVESMPFEPDAMVLKTLLGACRACGDIELARIVASRIMTVEPDEHCTYVLLSDLYGHLRLWDERAHVKRLMRRRGVKKVPGWSWIEVENKVRAFRAEDRSDPRCDEIYSLLGVLMDEITRLNDDDGLEVLVDDFDAL